MIYGYLLFAGTSMLIHVYKWIEFGYNIMCTHRYHIVKN